MGNGHKMAKESKSKVSRGKKPTKTESFSMDGDHLVMYLHDTGAKNSQYVRVDLNDYYTFEKFYMIMDRAKLKEMADFIYRYLEQN